MKTGRKPRHLCYRVFPGWSSPREKENNPAGARRLLCLDSLSWSACAPQEECPSKVWMSGWLPRPLSPSCRRRWFGQQLWHSNWRRDGFLSVFTFNSLSSPQIVVMCEILSLGSDEDSIVENWKLDVLNVAKLCVTYFGHRNDGDSNSLSCATAHPSIHCWCKLWCPLLPAADKHASKREMKIFLTSVSADAPFLFLYWHCHP